MTAAVAAKMLGVSRYGFLQAVIAAGETHDALCDGKTVYSIDKDGELECAENLEPYLPG